MWKFAKKRQKMTLLRYVNPQSAVLKHVSESFSIVKIHCHLKKRPIFDPPLTMGFRNPNDPFLSYTYENAPFLKNGLGYI